MLSLRILLLIVVARATGRQVGHEHRNRYESVPLSYPSFTSFSAPLPYSYYSYSSPSNKQWTSQRPTQQFQHLQMENGNSLAGAEIAMEILSKTLPPNMLSSDDAASEQETPQDAFDFWLRKNNFLTTKDKKTQGRGVQQKKFISKNLNWPEMAFSDDIATSPVIVSNDYVTLGDQEKQMNETADISDELQSGAKVTKNMAEVSVIPNSQEEQDNFGNLAKRTPLAIGHYHFLQDNSNLAKLRSSKRERTRTTRPTFLPSISTGAMTHLGHFFNDLSNNVHFNEGNELQEAETKLLEGNHPLRMLQHDINEADDKTRIDKTAQFLQAIRTYRPSQKIRSLVSMNPQGYHGSNFLDPNYMWVGLG